MVEITALWPIGAPGFNEGALSDEELLSDLVRAVPTVRTNFVSSVDGAATREGRSGGLSDDADKRYFELLRRACDVVLVGAGTVRIEGYGPMRVSSESARWRRAHGESEHPVFAIVSGSLNIDPGSNIFVDAPVRPIVFTSERVSLERRGEFADVADVVALGAQSVDAVAMVAELNRRGLTRVLCEGGPNLLASMLDADVVDELCLTIAPTLEGSAGPRMTDELARARGLTLQSVLSSGSTLLLRYGRSR